MADLGVSVGYLGRIARLIRAPLRTEGEQEFKRFWQQAKALTNPQDAYLAITPERGGVRTYFRHSFGPIELLDDEAWATLNLTRTFCRLKTQRHS
jgi:hypothetical protein